MVTEAGPATQPADRRAAGLPLPLACGRSPRSWSSEGWASSWRRSDRATIPSGGLIGLQAIPGRRGLASSGWHDRVGGGSAAAHPWAWGLTMLIVGIGLAVNLVAYFGGDPNYLRMAIFVLMAFYLNQRPVSEVFLGPSAGGSGYDHRDRGSVSPRTSSSSARTSRSSVTTTASCSSRRRRRLSARSATCCRVVRARSGGRRPGRAR